MTTIERQPVPDPSTWTNLFALHQQLADTLHGMRLSDASLDESLRAATSLAFHLVGSTIDALYLAHKLEHATEKES